MDQKFWLSVLAASLPTILLVTVVLLIGQRVPLSDLVEALVAIILALMAGVVLAAMVNGTINLSKLISEDNGNASLSRFQFLVFTFVIAGSYFMMMVLYTSRYKDMYGAVAAAAAAVDKASSSSAAEAASQLKSTLDAVKTVFGFQLPDIPNGVLGLIGLSGGSYVIAKGIQKSSEGDGGPGVASVTVITAGSGYAPSAHIPVTIGGGGGVNASGYASTDAAGTITSVTVTAPGSGYSAAPSVTVPAPGAGGTQAQLQAVLAAA